MILLKIKLAGVPSNSGGLYTGTEMTPKILRQAGIIGLFEKQGIEVLDIGDVNIPSYIPRHNIPPIRNWPGPRIVWEEIYKQSENWFENDDLILILGGDCSIVAGTMQSVHRRYGDKTHLVVIDAHIDVYKPSSDRCIGAAGSGVWFLLESNHFFNTLNGFSGSNVTILGYQQETEINKDITMYSLWEIREKGIELIAKKVLDSIPEDSSILIHLDLDAIAKKEMYAVYSPSEEGFSIEEVKTLLRKILADSRVVGIEITEFFGLHDIDGSQALKLIELIADAMRN